LHSSTRIMTLAEWQHMTKATVKPFYTSDPEPDEPKIYTVPDYSWLTGQWRWELFHLKDYLVSSISAGTIWLVERTNA
jgi:hypothetical protein